MILCQNVTELKNLVSGFKRENRSVGLVPTMGALHEGHASLIKASHAENDITVVSVFVNPTQFGPNEDYEAYPRTLDKDCIVAENAGADIVFAPKKDDLYPHEDMTWVEVTGDITKVLCGRSRPVHFRGVTTVIAKLFNLTTPDRAYFGLKDAQQTQVLQCMVEDLFFNVELRIMPIVREADGLAKSSRNVYLSLKEREAALILYKSLKHAQDLFRRGERNSAEIIQEVTDMIKSKPMSSIDYVEMYKLPGLLPVGENISGKVLLAVAVKFGTTRLIDNTVLEEK